MKTKLADIYYRNRNIDENIVEANSILEMDELTKQLETIVQQLSLLANKQTEQDQQMAFLNSQLEKTNEIKTKTGNMGITDLFRIPDPIKSIPSFDGSRKQLNAWLKTVEDTLNVFAPMVTEQQFVLYLQAINNKIEGKAKDVLCLAGNPQSFQEIKQILIEALGDRQELSYYKSQLWSTKQSENTSVHSYFNKIKEICQNIKSLSKQKPLYNNSWQAINAFIEEDALAAFLSGLRKPYFGYAQAAKPQCIEEAYAFLCKFSSNEIISNNSRKINTQQNYNQANVRKTNVFETSNKPKGYNSVSNLKHKNDTPIPMEVDPSLRSRLSFNKRNINNTEICSNEQEEEENSNPQDLGESDLGEINFRTDHDSDTEG